MTYLELTTQRLDLQPTDTVVIKHPAVLSPESKRLLLENAKSVFPNHKVIVLDAGADIVAVGEQV